MDILKLAERKNLIKISDDKSTITFTHQGLKRNYNNPEEKVQAEAFCKLVLEYNYPVENIM